MVIDGESIRKLYILGYLLAAHLQLYFRDTILKPLMKQLEHCLSLPRIVNTK